MITLLCVGKIKDKSNKLLCDDYSKRISFFDKIQILELKDSTQKDETNLIIDYVKNHTGKTYILLDEKGDEFDSLQFSKKIKNYFDEQMDIVFIISGALGIEKNKKKLFENKLSLSKLTFPHEIARVLLLEQIYRAYMIMNNRNYHKE